MISPLLLVFLVTQCSGKFITEYKHSNGNAYSINTQCYRGQDYWCTNITTSVECNAFKHCVHGVWEKEKPIELDESSVCQTCIDMVKLARDQLNSNETQEELRQVLEASCKVIPVKALRMDCDKMMDEFGSYLVDTLSSEMDPNVVCSVAGLCYNDKLSQLDMRNAIKLDCDNCYGLMDQVKGNIELASREDLFTVLAGVCGKLGSFSDVCSSLIFEHMESVDALIRNYIKPQPICTLAGVCSKGFHSHEKLVSVELKSQVEIILTKQRDNLPCDLCQQLVMHLKDVLVTNTTEQEFKDVLRGFCMMSVYKDECDSIINEYYPTLYNFLINELNGKVLCREINICPQKSGHIIRPLIMTKEPAPQLPIERMNPLTIIPSLLSENVQTNKELCAFCEYFLHFVQQEITLPSSEKEITDVVKNVCAKLPSIVTEQCDSFMDRYMAAFIALLAQRIDPSQVCPSIGVCPSTLIAVEYKDKPTCPLCLLALDATLRKLENKTETDINDALDDLCLIDVFPHSIIAECAKFITDYRKPITDMVLAEFTSQESCVYINLCEIPHSFTNSIPVPVGDITTNEIRQYDKSNTCVLCEFVLAKIDDALKNKKSEEEIKHTVLKICNYMPKTVSAECKSFITQYADLVIDLLTQEIDPKEICSKLSLCSAANQLFAGPVKKCIACELLMDSLRTILTNPNIDKDFNTNLLRACENFPRHEISFCKSMVEQLAPQIEVALRTLPIGSLVCKRIHLCENDVGHRVQLIGRFGASQCYLGSSYWCSSTIRAAECKQIEYCQMHIWHSDKPKTHLKGTVVI